MHSGCSSVSVVGSCQAVGRHGVGSEVPGLQCVLVATAEPKITLLSHILSQIQCGKVQTVISGLGNEYLPTIKLPGIMTWDAKHTVDGIVRMITVQIWPKDGVSTSGIPKEG